MLKKSQIAILAVGGSITLAIGAFYVIKNRTSYWLPKPLYCQVFPTTDKRHPGEVEICINSIRVPYSADNGDVELDITFMKSPLERVQADATVWVADAIAGKRVDYTGEINWSRVRTFENNILVVDETRKRSAWVSPVVPSDVHIPMWKWIYGLTPTFDRERLSVDDKFDYLISKFVEGMSVLGTAGVTIYKFFRATHG